MRPSFWLRLCALGGALGTLLAVVSGVWDLGTGHNALAALALPPLAAVVAAAWVAHRRLLAPSLAALVLFGLAAAITAPGLHLTLAGLAFAASLVTTALAFRGQPEPVGSWRDYVTLTKPRIMTLLLLTGICGMFVGEGGVPPLWLVAVTALGLGLACGGASALNHVLDADIDKLMGKRTRSRPVASGRVSATYALEFGLALSALSFVVLAGFVNVLTAALALLGNLFYVFVYTRWLKRWTPQNIVIGGAAGAIPPLVGWAAATGNLTLPAGAVRRRLPLDAAALLGACAPHSARLRGGGCADAAGRARRARDGAPDRPLHRGAGRFHAGAGPLGHVRRVLCRCGRGPRRALPLARVAATPRAHATAGSCPLPLLARLPRTAVRSDGAGPASCDGTDPEAYAAQAVHEPRDPDLEDATTNNLLALALFAAFLVLFGGTFLVGLLYLAFD